MKKQTLLSLRIFICIFAAALTLYIHINKNNDLTAVQLAIPELEKDVRALHLKNERLQYEIDQFESPIHLMELLKKPEFSHLKYPYVRDVIVLPGEKSEKG
ncbi:MAG: hypothetical protein ACE5GN_01045 [Waddliaceae bacterium]